jgi:hypothetical protein
MLKPPASFGGQPEEPGHVFGRGKPPIEGNLNLSLGGVRELDAFATWPGLQAGQGDLQGLGRHGQGRKPCMARAVLFKLGELAFQAALGLGGQFPAVLLFGAGKLRKQGALAVDAGRLQSGRAAWPALLARPDARFALGGEEEAFRSCLGQSLKQGIGRNRVACCECSQASAQRWGELWERAPDFDVVQCCGEIWPQRLRGAGKPLFQGEPGPQVEHEPAACLGQVARGEREGKAQRWPVRSGGQQPAADQPFAQPHDPRRRLRRIGRTLFGEEEQAACSAWTKTEPPRSAVPMQGEDRHVLGRGVDLFDAQANEFRCQLVCQNAEEVGLHPVSLCWAWGATGTCGRFVDSGGRPVGRPWWWAVHGRADGLVLPSAAIRVSRLVAPDHFDLLPVALAVDAQGSHWGAGALSRAMPISSPHSTQDPNSPSSMRVRACWIFLISLRSRRAISG